MSTMNISLPDTLKSFVDEQVSQRGYGTSSEYVRELIHKDQDRLQLRNLLLDGATSAPAAAADASYFGGLRDRVRKSSLSIKIGGWPQSTSAWIWGNSSARNSGK
jgi:antitoxin ParD1/3/4